MHGYILAADMQIQKSFSVPGQNVPHALQPVSTVSRLGGGSAIEQLCVSFDKVKELIESTFLVIPSTILYVAQE